MTFTDGVVGGSIGWEKRQQSNGARIGGDPPDGATFTVGGANGPFYCAGNMTNPVEVVDNDVRDSSDTNGEFVAQQRLPRDVHGDRDGRTTWLRA